MNKITTNAELKLIRSKIEGKIYELMNDLKIDHTVLWDCGANGIARVYFTHNLMEIEWFDNPPMNFILWSESKHEQNLKRYGKTCYYHGKSHMATNR